MKILVATGSSGGHIFPAVSFIEALGRRDEKIETLLVLPRKSVQEETLAGRCKVTHISVSTIKPSLGFRNLAALLDFAKGAFESLFLLIEFRPDAVVGFGSLNSIPLVLLAWLFRIKTVIHEQNVLPGRANRVLAKVADTIAVSFVESKKYFEAEIDKIVVTGNPVRRDLAKIPRQEALKFFGLEEGKITILVVGGSQGSHRINMCFLEALSLMPDHSRFQVIHITGSRDFDEVVERYQDLDVKVELFAFLKEMHYAYSAADVAISRAGATTTVELIAFKLPAILIPYPYAYAHQAENARVLEKMKTALVIKDEALDGRILSHMVTTFVNDPQKGKALRAHFPEIVPDAAELLAQAALSDK